MLISFTAVAAGLLLILWSADRFVTGSAASARHFGMPPLLIGMLIVGFGTSAPEMIVSAIAALQDSPGIALGNAYGSNIANIAMVLGLTAMISPVTVSSTVLKKELPILTGVTAAAAFQLWDGALSRYEAAALLALFMGVIIWTIRQQVVCSKTDSLAAQVESQIDTVETTLPSAIFRLLTGLAVLILSSRLMVWGAVDIATRLGVSNLVIGLTVVAIGTSLPELASSIIAARKGEHDIALGNILGSNLFNTLAVVGIAGTIHPMNPGPEIFSRDVSVTSLLTLSLFIICHGFRGRPGRINRLEGMLLFAVYAAYLTFLIAPIVKGNS